MVLRSMVPSTFQHDQRLVALTDDLLHVVYLMLHSTSISKHYIANIFYLLNRAPG